MHFMGCLIAYICTEEDYKGGRGRIWTGRVYGHQMTISGTWAVPENTCH